MAKMMELNIGIGYHYAPIHLFTLYRERGFHEGMFPVAERVGRLTVTLPMFYAMTLTDVERAVEAVKSVLSCP
jgi:dTDP-4-amino-4,6-dideoxygalactose transaminase